MENHSERHWKISQFLAAAIEFDEESGNTKIGDEMPDMVAELEQDQCLLLRGRSNNEEKRATVRGKTAFEEAGTFGKGDSIRTCTWRGAGDANRVKASRNGDEGRAEAPD